ncbi:hypothetical protein CI088_12085 [Enterococcus plantarum]|uniref:Uncharacterized protein n=1 Tax=Enterococcus plantarum TaxID=1077675 RepID=A0A2W3YVW0_9ENTE|nr:hypothetical protein [Enterococcus plantarum]PZL71731.1 hypothetical protein CI088_12085 [Enterococcus plantarum]
MKKINNFLSKHWDEIIMIVATFSVMVNMAIGNDLRALIYIILMCGLGMQRTVEELIDWVKTLCNLLYHLEKDRKG